MNLKSVYLVLCLLGILLPFSRFIPWLMQHGFDIHLFMQALMTSAIAAFFALDVVVSAMVLVVFIVYESRRISMKGAGLPIAATFLVGVSLGLPLFLYMRQRCLENEQI
ncbi:DUF2834 domain-containing protein [Neptunicella marina]|uniref:DUF2834 domain-containing protein n=1 Tax=Neptunicella marina TaxID=2125989 RepID=A0A8J6IX32_9ALTE|nr:DUF2834 domain-containing protein [Neptunicella marina]MBC3767127.1 DUF2834 domain-containing protein [Neptunicella marina]